MTKLQYGFASKLSCCFKFSNSQMKFKQNSKYWNSHKNNFKKTPCKELNKQHNYQLNNFCNTLIKYFQTGLRLTKHEGN